MSERMDRRQALRSLGASAVAPFLPRLHAALPQKEGDWKPAALRADEVDMVAAIAESDPYSQLNLNLAQAD